MNKVQKTQISKIRENIQIHQKSLNKLKKIAQNRNFKGESLFFDKLANNNDRSWLSIDNNKYFVSSDKFMVFSNLENYQEIINSNRVIKKLFTISDSNYLHTKFVKNSKNSILKLNNFSYHLSNIREVTQILAIQYEVFQDTEGLLICKNKEKFILIAPIII